MKSPLQPRSHLECPLCTVTLLLLRSRLPVAPAPDLLLRFVHEVCDLLPRQSSRSYFVSGRFQVAFIFGAIEGLKQLFESLAIQSTPLLSALLDRSSQRLRSLRAETPNEVG